MRAVRVGRRGRAGCRYREGRSVHGVHGSTPSANRLHNSMAPNQTKATISKAERGAHLVVGGKHAHVERAGAHHGGAGAGEQALDALVLHNAAQRVKRVLVVAALLGRQGGVCLQGGQGRAARGGWRVSWGGALRGGSDNTAMHPIGSSTPVHIPTRLKF